MEVRKAADVTGAQTPAPEEMARINQYAPKELQPEEVFAFSVRLCDNQVDRDYERFTRQALEELAARFVGKSGIFDHQWSAKGQAARIYQTEVVETPEGQVYAGERPAYLKAKAYMLRTPSNAELIAEIEGGIKKEVSVGCAVELTRCSICGKPMDGAEGCPHRRGRTYEGKLCWAELVGVVDAYEWSFVAVPAQAASGVLTKGRGRSTTPQALEEEAALGRKYLKELRQEVARLGGLAEPDLPRDLVGAMVEQLEEPQLVSLRLAYQARVEAQYCNGVQLPQRTQTPGSGGRDGAFII